MKSMEFIAIGLPKAQPRAKACIRGKRAGVYDPGTANDWKSIVRAAALEEWDRVQFTEAIMVSVTFFMPRPKSHYTKKGLKPDAPYYVTSKPDLDNLEKALLDALTNIGLWRDDAQVVSVKKMKAYTEWPPHAAVVIREVVE